MTLFRTTLLLLSAALLNAAETPTQKYSTIKESCVLQSEHRDANQDQLKALLMEQVKRDAVEEIFGTKLASDTLIVDGKLVSDRVRQVAAGSVQVKGQAKFYNGTNFGEVCTKVEAYVSEKDFQKYQPQTFKMKGFCYNDPDVSLKLLKSKAEFAAYKKTIANFRPKMKNISDAKAESFMRGFQKSNENLDIQTGVFCMDFSAKIFPYELDQPQNDNVNVSNETTNGSKNGLVVTFYNNKDYAFKKPIHQTTINQDLSLFGKNFTNATLQKDRAYYVKVKGFVYSNVDRYANYKLKADVYNVEVKINNKRVVNKHETRGGVGLKAGYNPIEILITSSNAYDVTLLEKQDGGLFKPLSISKLFIKE